MDLTIVYIFCLTILGWLCLLYSDFNQVIREMEGKPPHSHGPYKALAIALWIVAGLLLAYNLFFLVLKYIYV